MNEKNKKIVITSNSFFDKKKQRFEEVDNSLIKKGKCFKNKKGQFDIIFNNQNEGKDLVELKTDEYKLSFNLIGKKEEGNYKLNKKDFRKVHDTKVIIDNVFEDEDLEFEIVNNNEIKELIVINKNNKESYEYEYEIKVENLNAYEDLSNQTIVFKDLKGNIAFMFPKLVMYDSNGNKSNSLKYQLIEIKKGKYRLIVSADKKWINDKERTTPIYIDPTIQMESDYYFTLIEQITDNPPQDSKTYNRGSTVDYNHAYLAVHYYLDYIQKIANTTSIKIILDVEVSFEDAASTMFEVYEYFGCYGCVNYNSSALRKINSSQKYMGRDGNFNKYQLVFDICEPFIKNQSTYFFIKKNNNIGYGIIDYKVECSFKCSEGLIKTTPLTDYLFHNYDLLFGKNNLLLNLMGGDSPLPLMVNINYLRRNSNYLHYNSIIKSEQLKTNYDMSVVKIEDNYYLLDSANNYTYIFKKDITNKNNEGEEVIVDSYYYLSTDDNYRMNINEEEGIITLFSKDIIYTFEESSIDQYDLKTIYNVKFEQSINIEKNNGVTTITNGEKSIVVNNDEICYNGKYGILIDRYLDGTTDTETNATSTPISRITIVNKEEGSDELSVIERYDFAYQPSLSKMTITCSTGVVYEICDYGKTIKKKETLSFISNETVEEKTQQEFKEIIKIEQNNFHDISITNEYGEKQKIVFTEEGEIFNSFLYDNSEDSTIINTKGIVQFMNSQIIFKGKDGVIKGVDNPNNGYKIEELTNNTKTGRINGNTIYALTNSSNAINKTIPASYFHYDENKMYTVGMFVKKSYNSKLTINFSSYDDNNGVELNYQNTKTDDWQYISIAVLEYNPEDYILTMTGESLKADEEILISCVFIKPNENTFVSCKTDKKETNKNNDESTSTDNEGTDENNDESKVCMSIYGVEDEIRIESDQYERVIKNETYNYMEGKQKTIKYSYIDNTKVISTISESAENQTVTGNGEDDSVLKTMYKYENNELKYIITKDYIIEYTKTKDENNNFTFSQQKFVYNLSKPFNELSVTDDLDIVCPTNAFRSSVTYNKYGQPISSTNERGTIVATNSYLDEFLMSQSVSSLSTKNYCYENRKLKKISANIDSMNVFNDLFYNKNLLTKLVTKNGVTYNYSYNEDRILCNFSMSVGVYELMNIDYHYKPNFEYLYDGQTNGYDCYEEVYINGKSIKYVYDEFDRLILVAEKTGNSDYQFKTQITYNDNSTLSTIQEFIDDDNYTIAWYDYYDNGERIKERGVAGLYTLKVTGEEYSPFTLSQSTSFLFDNTETITYQYKYSTKDETLEQIEYDNCIVKIEQDNFNRLSKYVKTFSNEKGFETSFAYLTAEGTTSNFLTNLVSTITHKYKVSENNSVTFFNENYEYYGNNNIKKQTINSKKNDYVYDVFNRLYRENNENLGFTKIINYDSFGNIINIKKYDYSTTDSLVNESTETFTYVKNRLTKVQRSDGTYIELGGYDGMSNPTIISKYELCENGGGCELQAKQLTYSRNNRLMSYGDVIFGYDHNGTRVLKTQGSKKHVYYVDEGVILKEAITDTSTNSITNIYYYYDCTGICAFKLNNVMYHYIKDLTGNIIAIYNESGTLVARYVYDAWGNHKVYNPTQEDNNPLSVGNINPFRYKGYYYDVETQLFYCNSRYYSPELCRWISPDSIEYLDPESINGLNLYCYCYNNPISYYDPSGHSALLIGLLIFTGAMTLGGAIYGGVSAGMAGGDVGYVFAGIGKGALNGLILGGGISLAIGGFAIGGTTILGSIMATYGLSISANMLEVAITQGKKSAYDGDSFWAGANDINNAMFANSGNILIGKPTLMSIPFYGTRMTSKIPTIFNVLVSYDLDKFFGSTTFLASAKATLLSKASPFGLAMGYGLTAWQYYNLIRAIVSTPDFENSRWILY